MGHPGRDTRRRPDRKPVAPRPGTEKLDLDLSKVPTVEQGLADAAERDRRFVGLSKAAFGEGPDRPLFEEHLAFFSFINRATSLHRGIVSAVRDANPHVAFTLLRAYLELVVLVYYLDSNPEYIEALKRPMKELPPQTRRRFSDLFEFAGREIAGVVTTYEVLNEMAHFGSTALWHPFVINDEERRFAFSTAPGWRKPDDARTVLAMLQESDDAMVETLRRYSAHHVMPHVERYLGRRRILDALVGAGGTIVNEPARRSERVCASGISGRQPVSSPRSVASPLISGGSSSRTRAGSMRTSGETPASVHSWSIIERIGSARPVATFTTSGARPSLPLARLSSRSR